MFYPCDVSVNLAGSSVNELLLKVIIWNQVNNDIMVNFTDWHYEVPSCHV